MVPRKLALAVGVCIVASGAFYCFADEKMPGGTIRLNDGTSIPFERINISCIGCDVKSDLAGSYIMYAKTVKELMGPYQNRLPKKDLKGLTRIRFEVNTPNEQQEIGGIDGYRGYQCKQANAAKPSPGSACPVRKLSLFFSDGTHLDNIFLILAGCCGPTSATGPEARQYEFQELDIIEVMIGSAKAR